MRIQQEVTRLLATAYRLWRTGKLTVEQYVSLSQQLVAWAARQGR